MIFHVSILLIPLVSANYANYVKVTRDVNRIERRLRTIEDNLAEERIQRREDVQSVLDKLSELKNTIEENYGNKMNNRNEFDADKPARTIIGRITHAFAKEKQANLRFRREIEGKLRDQSSDVMKKIASVETQLEDVVTRGDLSNAVNIIIGKTRQLSTNIGTKIEKKIENLDDNTDKTSKKLMDNLSEMQQQIDKTEGTCQTTDKKLEKFRRLGVTTLTTNLNTPSDAECLANLVDKSKASFSSCMEFKYAGFTKSGVYKIKVKNRYLQVYCDQATDGGGWIVFQRRKDGSVDFHRTWNEFKHGFGDLEGEFWLGNDNLAELTENCCHELRVDLADIDGSTSYAKYNEFRVLDARSLYELNIGTYSGNAGDSLGVHNKMKFSTKDSDNDEKDNYHCAAEWKGAWWFKSCFFTHLNGIYHVGGFVKRNYRRISWVTWKDERHSGGYHSLTFSEMKFR